MLYTDLPEERAEEFGRSMLPILLEDEKMEPLIEDFFKTYMERSKTPDEYEFMVCVGFTIICSDQLLKLREWLIAIDRRNGQDQGASWREIKNTFKL